MKRADSGFTLVEIVVTLVLIGIMSAFMGLFMKSFFDGYFMVRNNASTAMKAQMALDRMSIELKDITSMTAITDNSSITYVNSSGTGRTIKFTQANGNIYLSTPADNILIDRIQTFQLSAAYGNMYSIAANDVAYIDIGFAINGIDPFSTRIFPRNRVQHP